MHFSLIINSVLLFALGGYCLISTSNVGSSKSVSKKCIATPIKECSSGVIGNDQTTISVSGPGKENVEAKIGSEALLMPCPIKIPKGEGKINISKLRTSSKH